MFSKQTRLIGQTIWILLLLLQASCGVMQTPQAAVEADAPATSRPPIVNRVVDESLPEICNCILRFDMIGIEEGLSQSSVHTIFQDSRGFLWFGTEDGLNRYDGYTFKVYKHDPDNEASISDGWINAIAEDQNGYLWIGTRLGGLNRYDPLTDEFTTYQHVRSEETSLIDNHVLSLLVDNKNQLWIGTTNGLTDSIPLHKHSFIIHTLTRQRLRTTLLNHPTRRIYPARTPKQKRSAAASLLRCIKTRSANLDRHVR
ncbi:MAG: two-component regulator propeller domain-containing protein [Anaerolineales bacterium]